MSETRVHGVTVFLGDDPAVIEVRYQADHMGEYAVLNIDSIQFHVSTASPEYLQRMSQAFAELAAFRSSQTAAKAVAA